MAHQPVVPRVIRQRDTAIRTRFHRTAGIAGGKRVVAAAVQKQNRLISGFQIFGKRLHQRRADIGKAVAVTDLPCVHRQHFGKQSVSVTVFERIKRILTAFGACIAFKRRRCGSKQKQCVVIFHAKSGNIACMITRRHFRFISVLLFFIHNDKSDIGKRSKHRRTCSQSNFCFPFFYALPLVEPLAHRKRAVEDRYFTAVTFIENGKHLRR